MKKTISGFTLVELLIVIVVIAILAAISIVAYTGIQSRANDASIRSAATQIERAMRLYAVDHGGNLLGGSGSAVSATPGIGCTDGGGSGFFGVGNYACGAENTLIERGFLPSGFTAGLPSNTYRDGINNGRQSIMLYRCTLVNGGAGVYALYWTLRSPSTQDANSFDTTRSRCGNGVNIRDTWGMRAGMVVDLR